MDNFWWKSGKEGGNVEKGWEKDLTTIQCSWNNENSGNSGG